MEASSLLDVHTSTLSCYYVYLELVIVSLHRDTIPSSRADPSS